MENSGATNPPRLNLDFQISLEYVLWLTVLE